MKNRMKKNKIIGNICSIIVLLLLCLSCTKTQTVQTPVHLLETVTLNSWCIELPQNEYKKRRDYDDTLYVVIPEKNIRMTAFKSRWTIGEGMKGYEMARLMCDVSNELNMFQSCVIQPRENDVLIMAQMPNDAEQIIYLMIWLDTRYNTDSMITCWTDVKHISECAKIIDSIKLCN